VTGLSWLRSPLADNPLQSRDDVLRACLDLAAPVLPYLTQSGAQARLGGPAQRYTDTVAGMEGAARLLWGLAPAGCQPGPAPMLDRLVAGFRAGTDPAHPDYWGEIHDADQRMVEMAAVAFALMILPTDRLACLDHTTRANLIAWLDQINRKEPVANNWQFFRVFANLGIRALGGPHDENALVKALDNIDAFYLGDGWYSDGATEQRDYYVPFAFHFYGLIYAALMAKADPDRAERFRERARLFAPGFAHFFGPDGAAIPFGRSMTYRFAQAAFWGALAFAGEEALPWGQIKGLYMRHLRWWRDKPITDRDGVLTLGHAYPNQLMNEQYNAAGSPYWAFKVFLPLALADDHPFWRAEEGPHQAGGTLPLRKAGAIVSCGSHAVLYPVGQSNTRHRGGPDKYARFAYSSAFGFSVESVERLDLAAGDNMLILSDDAGRHIRRREGSADWHVDDTWARSRWHPWDDVEVETFIMPLGDWHLRAHRITARRALVGAEGGFALPIGDGDGFTDHWAKRTVERRAFLDNTCGACGLVDMGGDRTPSVVLALPNTNLMHKRTAIPRLSGAIPPGTTWIVTSVFATPDPAAAGARWQNPPDADLLWQAIGRRPDDDM
jgi:hypothetical protein